MEEDHKKTPYFFVMHPAAFCCFPAFTDSWLAALQDGKPCYYFRLKNNHKIFGQNNGRARCCSTVRPCVITTIQSCHFWENSSMCMRSGCPKSKYLVGASVALVYLHHLPYLHYMANAVGKGHLLTSRKHANAWFQLIFSSSNSRFQI